MLLHLLFVVLSLKFVPLQHVDLDLLVFDAFMEVADQVFLVELHRTARLVHGVGLGAFRLHENVVQVLAHFGQNLLQLLLFVFLVDKLNKLFFLLH